MANSRTFSWSEIIEADYARRLIHHGEDDFSGAFLRFLYPVRRFPLVTRVLFIAGAMTTPIFTGFSTSYLDCINTGHRLPAPKAIRPGELINVRSAGAGS